MMIWSDDDQKIKSSDNIIRRIKIAILDVDRPRRVSYISNNRTLECKILLLIVDVRTDEIQGTES